LTPSEETSPTADAGGDLAAYYRLKTAIVPHLRFNQSIYEGTLTTHVSPATVWLDAGCGHHILPSWRHEAEQRLAACAKLAVGCDVDAPSVREHKTLDQLLVANLETLPFKSESFDLITSNMVVEHLPAPASVFGEFSRLLRPGGRVIIHTPNVYSHFVLASRLLPDSLKRKVIKRLDGRDAHDVFPALYRANSPSRLRSLMTRAGLRQDWCRMVANDAVLARAHPLFAALELLYIRLTLRPMFRLLRVTILASFVKPAR
jgi:2-polyprenyl-3-methyl-5-hydroxy-6-metoxy-1,4-benzoquinol methylase